MVLQAPFHLLTWLHVVHFTKTRPHSICHFFQSVISTFHYSKFSSHQIPSWLEIFQDSWLAQISAQDHVSGI